MSSANATLGVIISLLCAGALSLMPVSGWAQSETAQMQPRKPSAITPTKATPQVRARPVAPTPRQIPVVEPHESARPPEPPSMRQPRLAHPSFRPEQPKPLSPTEFTSVSVLGQPSPLAKAEDPDKGSTSGLKLPRFAALRSDDVNLRAGPGTRYPIDWVYKRRDLPVEIEREFEVWRLVRDPDGTRGWVHQATLTGRRGFVVQGAHATLRGEPNDDAAPIAILKVGVIGRIRSCEAGAAWCRIRVGEYSGYLRRTQFWGTFPDEAVAP